MVDRLGKFMDSSQIRSEFLRFFAERGHTIVPSSSLVPQDDPTLLFTNAGMVQFKDIFLGRVKPPYPRAVTSQKCVRAGGKHNDLDNVGFDGRHHTFLEMLGNFSFGDYFKKQAIEYAWEFLLDVMGLPKENLWITVFREDDEAEHLWRTVAGVEPGRIVRLDEDENYWDMGDTGPCGPCSEIIVDRGPGLACGDDCALGVCDCDRWLEIWNLVFMQYTRGQDGTVTPLPKPSIDTGMGLERISSVVQGTPTNYETDLFVPIIRRLEEISETTVGAGVSAFPFHVIADHLRSCVFLASDGVIPSNEGRGYVMRRILRRAVRFGGELGIDDVFMPCLVPALVNIMGDAYPELREKQNYIEILLREEERRFRNTLSEGQRRALDIIASSAARGWKKVRGEDAFLLHDTFGFPIDLTKDLAREAGLGVDESGFYEAMTVQKTRSRASRVDATSKDDILADLLENCPTTVFTGYDQDEAVGKVVALVKDGERVCQLQAGDEAVVVLDVSPFYPSGGGQESDRGSLCATAPEDEESESGQLLAEVSEVTKTAGGIIVHRVKMVGPGLETGDSVVARVDKERRLGLKQHHTATHIIHKALRQILGSHATQSGSLVQEDRLRFDFANPTPLSPGQVSALEDEVNRVIMADLEVATDEMTRDQAQEAGAVGLFEEKYRQTVRVVDIEDCSKELCGGIHVRRTGEIGQVLLTSEAGVAAGLRRLEAVAGKAALKRVRQISGLVSELVSDLGVPENQLRRRVGQLLKTASSLEKAASKSAAEELEETARGLLSSAVSDEASRDPRIIVSRQDGKGMNDLRALGDRLKEGGASVVVLGTVREDRCSILVMVRDDAIEAGTDAVSLIREGAAVIGGSGGGKSRLAQAGGKDVQRLDEALSLIAEKAKKVLGATQS